MSGDTPPAEPSRDGNPASDQCLSALVVHVGCRWAACVLAATTAFVHVSQINQWPFVFCARASLAVFLALSVWAVWSFRRRLARVRPAQDWTVIGVLAAVALVGAVLGLISHRPNRDDYYYLGNAVYALEHPHAAMGFDIHFIYPGRGQPLFRSMLINTSGAYEYCAAIVAYWSGLNILSVYYDVFVVSNTCLLTAALFYLLTRFQDLDTISAAAGTAAALAGLILLAPTDRSPGNFAITHFFHGKAVLLTVWAPLFAAVSMNFLRATGTSRVWPEGLFLCALAVSGLGLSSTALVFLPALTMVLAIAAWAAGWRGVRTPRRVIGYFAALTYVGLGILYTYRYAVSNLGVYSVANQWAPLSFFRQFIMWMDPRRPLPLLVVMAMCASAIYLRSGAERRFLFAWFAAATLLFLNPIVCLFLMRHATSQNIYWRLFYLYPVTPAIGLVAAVCFARSRTRLTPPWRAGLIVAASVALAVAHFIPGMSTTFRAADEHLGWPGGEKLPPGVGAYVRELDSFVPAGPMLAPDALAGAIPLFSSHYPQYRNQDGEMLWLGSARGRMDEAVERMAASDFAATGESALRPAFTHLIASCPDPTDLRSVIVGSETLAATDADGILRAAGFQNRRQLVQGGGSYWVYWR